MTTDGAALDRFAELYSSCTDARHVVDMVELGWLGTARHVMLPALTDQLKAAIVQRAAELGVDVHDLETIEAGPGPIGIVIATGTAKTWLGADKLCAYIDGLHDALTGAYGNPPVEVGRKDLEQVLSALGRSFCMDPDANGAASRLRQVLDGQPGSAP